MKNIILTSLIVILSVFYSKAHVSLSNPSGGETFSPGNTVPIVWEELITHNTLNWDLYFSADGGLTWKIIQLDIPYETTDYVWTIPVTPTTQGKIKIVQDNLTGDYEDISGNFTISSVTGLSSQFERIKIKVYPNPMVGFSILEFDNPAHKIYTLTLSDTDGRRVRIIPHITTNKVKIERNNLRSGLYFFKLNTDNKANTTGRLLIK